MQRTLTLLFSFFVVQSFSIGFMADDSTRFGIATGINFSSDNIRRDISSAPHPGIDFKFQAYATNSIRISAEYTHFFRHDLGVIWKDVKSDLFEVNVQFIASIKDHKSKFYSIAGFAAQNWKGTYTGMGHEYEFRQYGSPQNYYSTTWPSLSIGCGTERAFKKIDVYGEFKYRISQRNDNVSISIMDVNYSLGVRYHIKAHQSKDGKRKSIFRMPGDRYHWF